MLQLVHMKNPFLPSMFKHVDLIGDWSDLANDWIRSLPLGQHLVLVIPLLLDFWSLAKVLRS